ncbi:ABC-type nitrate/sulfonate/bicarbonate transport system ATPase subunit [Lachnotalea glycerini]|uniref:ABC-type nitrate/sulfonate/bicarbonate transport system ATPase subunit n=2 Tax=Lachnotalea glycerini TaxID=1763509 RepID=A0A318EMD2_9FIRM|nr:ABC-type nitrate/sulfonate/bicarbonate transport system ATPase subunit [Lachnotalea glycerini]
MKEPACIKEKKKMKRATILLFWLLLWQVFASITNNAILLVGPFQVLKEILILVKTVDFYTTVLMSLIRIAGGFVIGFLLGMFLGIAAFFKPIIGDLFSPVISLLKSIPIASFVVLLLIWTGSDYLAVYVSILVVFPNAYLHTIMGLNHTDQKLLEMAEVFQMSFSKKFRYLYKPAMIPFLITCMEVAVGMSFKSGVAAEVIGTPNNSFGEKLYMSKIQLNTSGVFAWTIVIILASYAMEKGVLYVLKRYKENRFTLFSQKMHLAENGRTYKKHEVTRLELDCIKKQTEDPQPDNPKEAGSAPDIQIRDLSKFYDYKKVFYKVNLQLEKGKIYCLMGPSGCGKTTLFRILLGLTKPDEGEIIGVKKREISAVFQEPRLLEDYSAIENAFLFGLLSKNDFDEQQEFCRLLLAEDADKSAKELSGGMQQRVAILRAMALKASVIVLDEPFTGLDEETKRKTANYILEKKGNKTLIVSTHNKEDVLLLKGEMIDGNKSGFNWNYGREE